MIYPETTSDSVIEYTSLSLAINLLFDRQEKTYGCFQVFKEGDFCSLCIPALPSFKFYQNTKSIIYRGYWRRNQELPKATDTKNFPPDLWVKKRQKQVQVSISSNVNSKSESAREQQILSDITLDLQTAKSAKTIQVTKKQRIYEIVYRYNPSVEVMKVNQLIANLLKEKIIASIVDVPEAEIFPLVLVGNPQ